MESTLDIAWSCSQELNWTQPESWGWKNVGSGRFFQCIQTDPANWWAFKWTQGPLFSSFTGSVPQGYWLHLLKNSMHSLKNVLDSWYHWYLYSQPGFLYRSIRAPQAPRCLVHSQSWMNPDSRRKLQP